MTPLQVEVIALIIKQLIKAGERLAKVGEMTDDECRAAIPLIQANIDANDETIMGL
jgi:hypothetical protein